MSNAAEEWNLLDNCAVSTHDPEGVFELIVQRDQLLRADPDEDQSQPEAKIPPRAHRALVAAALRRSFTASRTIQHRTASPDTQYIYRQLRHFALRKRHV